MFTEIQEMPNPNFSVMEVFVRLNLITSLWCFAAVKLAIVMWNKRHERPNYTGKFQAHSQMEKSLIRTSLVADLGDGPGPPLFWVKHNRRKKKS